MVKSQSVRPEISRRILLAKELLRSARSATTADNDDLVFAKGIVLLHDAVDAMLGAIADHVQVKVAKNEKLYLMDYFDKIRDANPKKGELPYKREIKRLNSLRNAIKHDGILPSPKSNAFISDLVFDFLAEVAQSHLGIDFQSFSQLGLIKDANIRELLERARRKLDSGNCEGCLIDVAFVMYFICDHLAKPKSVQFNYFGLYAHSPQQPDWKMEHTLRLLANRVDPNLYLRFKDLTPEVIVEGDDLKHHWQRVPYGHPKNWTQGNCRFALDFCIDTAIKFQQDEAVGCSVENYQDHYKDELEVIAEEASFWNYPLPGESKVAVLLHGGQAPQVVTKLLRGKVISGVVTESGEPAYWMVTSSGLPGGEVDSRSVFVAKKDVKVRMQVAIKRA